jgi:6-phosphofructokinase
MNPHEFKELQTRVNQLKAEADVAVVAEREANQRRTQIQKRLWKAQQELAAAKRGLVISEHAILRYLERSGQADVALIAEGIRARVEPIVKKLGGEGRMTVPLPGGLRAVVKDNTVVTVETA